MSQLDRSHDNNKWQAICFTEDDTMQQAIKLTSSELSVYRSPESMVEVLRPSYPVYCVRPAKIRNIAKIFLERFPGDVLYAVKCNSEPHMLQELHQAGI